MGVALCLTAGMIAAAPLLGIWQANRWAQRHGLAHKVIKTAPYCEAITATHAAD